MRKSLGMGTQILIALLVAALLAPPAAANIELSQQGCIAYGVWSRDLVWARDVGADLEKVRASLAEMRDENKAAAGLYALLLRDLDAL